MLTVLARLVVHVVVEAAAAGVEAEGEVVVS